MAVDDELLVRVRAALAGRSHVSEQRMFGGVCFFLQGNMLCGTRDDGLMFRVGKDQEAEALARPGAKVMELNGRRMGGLINVAGKTCDADALRDWIALAANFVAALRAKTKA